MTMSVHWDVARCNLIEVYRRFRGVYCFHHEARIEDTGGTFQKTTILIYATNVLNIQLGCKLLSIHNRILIGKFLGRKFTC
jgi:hypothetical protein